MTQEPLVEKLAELLFNLDEYRFAGHSQSLKQELKHQWSSEYKERARRVLEMVEMELEDISCKCDNCHRRKRLSRVEEKQ